LPRGERVASRAPIPGGSVVDAGPMWNSAPDQARLEAELPPTLSRSATPGGGQAAAQC